jgi:NAD(P)-dependent dehydrogenase (short-subunit alcohol dehydrogenase family)
MDTVSHTDKDNTEFLGQRVLITGGSRGIGAAMVRRFLAGGATVAAVARTKPEDTPAMLFIEADLSNPKGAQVVVEKVMDSWGGVDILIDNLGPGSWLDTDFRGLPDDYWQNILEGNLLAAVRLDRAFVPGMIERGTGVVLHIGSFGHRLAQAGCMIAYTTAKGALATYSKGLSKSVGSSGVRVNMISPGFILPGGSSATVDMIAAGQGIQQEEAVQMLVEQLGIPLKRPGKPEEVAELAAFLASHRAGYIHGVDYMIDGGTLPTL